MEHITINQRLRLIGCSLDAELPNNQGGMYTDIEKTLVDALTSIPNFVDPMRMLTVLLSWVKVHGWCLNNAKFLKLLSSPEYRDVDHSYIILLAAYAFHEKLRNWKPILKHFEPHTLRRFELISDPAAISYRGREEWAEAFKLEVPKGALIPNNKWTLTRKSVAAINVQYRNRLLYGADWRADVITAIQMGATRPATIVKWIGISYEPAHRIFEDLKDAGLVEDEKTKNRIPA